MEITTASLDALRTDFELRFQTAYDGTPTWWQKIASEIASKTKSNLYGWAAKSTVMREWLGPRVAQNLSEHSYQLFNKKYEATIELPRDEIDDDNLGVFTGQAIPNLAEASRKHPDTLIAALLTSNPNGFDGVSFFNSAHPVQGAGAAYSNDFTVTGGLLTADAVNTVFANMAGYLGENGLPLAVRPKILMVPPSREREALVVMQSTTYALPGQAAGGGAATVENPLRGWAEVLVVPELAASPNVVYFIDTSKAIKPFIYQVRDAPEFVTRQNPDDPKVFNEDVFTYGVRQRDNVGVSLPFLVSRLTINA